MTRRLVIGAVGLVRGRVRGLGEACTVVRDELGAALEESNWFPDAPFKCVSLVLRLGTSSDELPQCGKVGKRYGELPVAIERRLDDLRALSTQPDQLREAVRSAVLICLARIAALYDLPCDSLPWLARAAVEVRSVQQRVAPDEPGVSSPARRRPRS